MDSLAFLYMPLLYVEKLLRANSRANIRKNGLSYSTEYKSF